MRLTIQGSVNINLITSAVRVCLIIFENDSTAGWEVDGNCLIKAGLEDCADLRISVQGLRKCIEFFFGPGKKEGDAIFCRN